LKISLLPDKVLLFEEDVSSAIRSAEITQASRFVADSPGVRRQLVQRQREFASEQDTVTEGRDQGTIVFPQATCKFFITASSDERARRRLAEHEARGEAATFESVLAAQHARDARDEARAIAPMKPAPDALVIDTTGRNIDQVVLELVERVLRAG
jgi:cytidylate kinase